MIFSYHWIWIVVPKNNFFIWVIVDSRNVTRLQNSTLHHLHYILAFTPIDGSTCFDVVLKKELACLCREIVRIKNQESIWVAL